jgi:hypothetical protein
MLADGPQGRDRWVCNPTRCRKPLCHAKMAWKLMRPTQGTRGSRRRRFARLTRNISWKLVPAHGIEYPPRPVTRAEALPDQKPGNPQATLCPISARPERSNVAWDRRRRSGAQECCLNASTRLRSLIMLVAPADPQKRFHKSLFFVQGRAVSQILISDFPMCRRFYTRHQR